MRMKMASILILGLVWLGIAGAVWAGDDSYAFAGPMGLYVWFNGDFDGTRTLSGSGETWVIPAVAPGLGYGGLVGRRMPLLDIDGLSMSMEAQFIYAPLEGTFSSTPHGVTYYNIEALMAPSYVLFGPLSAYAKAGVGFTWITIADGATDGVSSGDVFISGVEMSGGAGIVIDILGIVELRAGVSAHLSDITHGSGIAVSGNISPVDDSPFMVETALLVKF
jgi:hypothetical protein